MGGRRLRRLIGAAVRGVHRPRLSVIVRAAGTGPHVEGAIRSVLNQTFRDLEVLVVVGPGADALSSGEQVAPACPPGTGASGSCPATGTITGALARMAGWIPP